MTRVRQIIRLLQELERGVDSTLVPIPKETVFLKASQPVSGRAVPFPRMDDDYDDGGLPDIPIVWKPTEEPTPSRWYPARTKAHSRGTVTSSISRSAITFASKYEMRAARMFLANRKIVRVRDQPAPMPFTRNDVKHHHTTDYLTELDSGPRVYVAVRPTWLFDKDDLVDTIDRINHGALANVADEAVILTERELTEARGWNAGSVLHALRQPDADDNARLRTFVSSFRGVVCIDDFRHAIECSAAMWNAVFCLVYEGVLKPARPDVKLVDHPYVTIDPSLC